MISINVEGKSKDNTIINSPFYEDLNTEIRMDNKKVIKILKDVIEHTDYLCVKDMEDEPLLEAIDILKNINDKLKKKK